MVTKIWLIIVGHACFFAVSGEIHAYRTRGEAKEDLEAARKQCGRRNVRLVSFEGNLF